MAHIAHAADTYIWTGVNSSNWNTKENWYKSGSSSTHAVPSGGVNADFQNQYFDTRFNNDNRRVYFDGQRSNTWKVHIRNAGSESAPVVFTADTDANGLKVGNSTDGNNTGYYIANDNGNAWLRLAKGTYDTTGSGWWFVGNIDKEGHLTVDSGVTLDCSKTFDFRKGTVDTAGNLSIGTLKIGTKASTTATFRQTGGSLTTSGNLELGEFGNGNTGTSLFEITGGTVNCNGNLQVGSTGKAGSSSIIRVSGTGKLVVKDTADIYLGNSSAGEIYLSNGGELTARTVFFCQRSRTAILNLTLAASRK